MKAFIGVLLALLNFFNQPLIPSKEYDISIGTTFSSGKVIGRVENSRSSMIGLPAFPNGKLFFVSIHGENGSHCYFPTGIQRIFFNQIRVSGSLTNRKMFKAGPKGQFSSGHLFFPKLFKGQGFLERRMKEPEFPENLNGKQFGYFLMRKPFGERGAFFSRIFSFEMKDGNVLNGRYPEVVPKGTLSRIEFEQELWRVLIYFIEPGERNQYFWDEKVIGYFDFKTFPLLEIPLNAILILM